jgi:hypothetical protein
VSIKNKKKNVTSQTTNPKTVNTNHIYIDVRQSCGKNPSKFSFKNKENTDPVEKDVRKVVDNCLDKIFKVKESIKKGTKL